MRSAASLGWLLVMVLVPWASMGGGSAQAGDAVSAVPVAGRVAATASHIPDCRLAGYEYGSSADIFATAPRVRIADYGAVADDGGDDTHAIAAALLAAEAIQPVVLEFPVGTLQVASAIAIDRSGILLRGMGRGSSTIAFTRPLKDVYDDLGAEWSFRGGLIWFGSSLRMLPANSASSPEHVIPIAQPPPHRSFVIDDAQRGNQLIEGSTTMIALDAEHRRGVRASATAGIWVPAAISVRGSAALADHILGMKGFDWTKTSMLERGQMRFPDWTEVRFDRTMTRLELRKPLRVYAPGARVFIDHAPRIRLRCGIEGMTLAMPPHPRAGHLLDPGWNGIMFERVGHGLVRDVALINVDNGIILEDSWNVTVSDLRMAGQGHHHALSFRQSHDNLVTRFEIRSRSFHGLSTQDLSAGNVWSDGVLHGGTFDSHLGMPFDSIRTRIVLKQPRGRPGGDIEAGPYQGRRMVHWDIQVDTSELSDKERRRAAEWIFAPDYHPMGVLAGITGIDRFSTPRPWSMPIGASASTVILQDTKGVRPPCPRQ